MYARRQLLAALVLSTLATLAALSADSSAAAMLDEQADWPQFRLNPTNDAVVEGTLETYWRMRTNGAFSSSPTLAAQTVYIGNNSGMLYALDAMSGRVRWTFHAHNPIMSAPIVYHNAVIVAEGNENSPTDAMPSRPIHVGDGPNALIALDRGTGKLLWYHTLSGSGMPTPAIVDGLLVHHDGGGIVVGLDPRNGSVRYTHNIHSIASMVAALPVGNDRWITAGEWENALWELRGADGSIIWSSRFSRVASGVGDCPPASDGALVYCNYIMPPSSATPVLVGDIAVEHAYAVDLASGRKVWDVAVDRGMLPPRNEAAIPLVVSGTLYMGSSLEPYMNSIDSHTGRVRWRVRTHAPVLGGPVALDGVLYFGDLDGYLWAVSADNGRVVGDLYTGTPFNVGSPIIAGKTLVIGSRGGTLLAVPLKDIRSSRAV